MSAQKLPSDDDKLTNLLLGHLPPEEADRLATEMIDNSQVTPAAEKLPDDTLIASVKQATVSLDAEADQLASRLVERLKPEGEETTAAYPDAGEAAEPMPAELEYFKVEKEIGRGGMGMVYLARDTRLNRPVAIKTLRADLAKKASAKERFLREARVAAALEHESVVPIYYVGEAAGIPFLAMPVLKGQGLDAHLKAQGGKLSPAEVIRIAAQIAGGLAAAHAVGLIHRDIKPSNVWVDADGRRVRVLDFGLARYEADESHLTVSGMIVGTPAYMAPEQARGRGVDARADLFSLGVVMYQLLTGRRPFTGTDTVSIISSLALDSPPAPNVVNFDVPFELSDLVMRLLEKEPQNRPASATVVREALDRLATQPTEDRTELDFSPPTPPRRQPNSQPKAARKFPLVPLAIALGLLALLGGGAVAVYQFVFSTKDGTLVVEVDESADVRFKNGKLQVYDEKGELKYTVEPSEKNKALPPGMYTVKVVGADGVKLDTDKFEIEKNGKALVKVTATGPKEGVAKADPPQPAADLKGWVEGVAKLPADEQVKAVVAELKQRNPQYEGKHTHRVDGGVVVGLTVNGFVEDIAPVRGLAGLKELSVHRTKEGSAAPEPIPLNDLSPLRGMKLTHLKLHHTKVTDLTPLRGMLLEQFEAPHGPLSDLSPLSGMPLGWVALTGTQVSDLTPLKGANVSFLDIRDTTVTNLTPLQGQPLDNVNGSGKMTDLTAFKGFPKLRQLLWVGPEVSDISALRGSSIQNLDLRGTMVSDLTPLRGTPLESLSVDGSKVTGLTPIKDCPLRHLTCDYKPERDRELLLGIKTLETINGKPAKDVLDGKVVPAPPVLRPRWPLEPTPAEEMKFLAGLGVGMKVRDANGDHNFSDEWLAKPCTVVWATFWSANAAKVDDAVLRRVAKLTDLEYFQYNFHTYNGVSVTTEGSTALAALVNLRTFDVCHHFKGGFDGSVIAKMPHLERLNVSGIPGSVWVPHVGGMSRLHTIDTFNTPIAEDELNQLAKLPRLTLLLMHHPGVSDDAVKAFAKKVPWCKVSKDIGGGNVLVIEPTAPAPVGPTGFAPLDPEWVKAVAAMPPEQQYEAVVAELKKRNPEFTAKGPRNGRGIEGGVLAELTLDGKLADVTPARALPGLARLSVCNTPDHNAHELPLTDLNQFQGIKLTHLSVLHAAATDLAPLKGLPLRGLDLFMCEKVSDLSPLAGMPLERLSLRGTAVADLTPIKGMKLKHLDLSGTKVPTLEAVAGMPLESLETSRLISDLTPLKGMKLKLLHVEKRVVSDLSPLKGMPLEEFWGIGPLVKDLSPLEGMPLKAIDKYDLNLERDGKLLRSLKSLETINGQPAKDVLK